VVVAPPYRAARASRCIGLLAPLVANRARMPPTSSSLADERRVGSFLLSTSARDPLYWTARSARCDVRWIAAVVDARSGRTPLLTPCTWLALLAEAGAASVWRREQPGSARRRTKRTLAAWTGGLLLQPCRYPSSSASSACTSPPIGCQREGGRACALISASNLPIE
jgi:hypothetical protein